MVFFSIIQITDVDTIITDLDIRADIVSICIVYLCYKFNEKLYGCHYKTRK